MDATARAGEGDLAREALLLLVGDPDNQQPLAALIGSPPPERFLDAGTVAVGVAALIALQTYVKFERTKDGKVHFKIEKQPLPVGLMAKLISFFGQHPSGKAKHRLATTDFVSLGPCSQPERRPPPRPVATPRETIATSLGPCSEA